MKLSLLAAIAFGMTCSAHAAERFVDNRADTYTPPAGSSVYETIQAAVDASAAGDIVTVYPGVYRRLDTEPNSVPVVDLKGKQITVRALYYNAAWDTPTAQESIIDGSKVQADGSSIKFRRGMVCNSGEGAATSIVGLRFENCSSGLGAALFIGGTSPRLDQCLFRNNAAALEGGALSASNSASVVTDCLFRSNSSSTVGGGVFVSGGAVELVRCVFESNSSQFGAGAHLTEDQTSLVNCSFVLNQTSGPSARGGGAYAKNSRANFDSCEFRENRLPAIIACNNYGAGLAVVGPTGHVTCSSCTFVRNTALCGGRGGGVAVYGGSSPTSLQFIVSDSGFLDNYADAFGGAIYTDSTPSMAVRGCSFERNGSFYHGGAIMVESASYPPRSWEISRSRFVENRVVASGNSGGAIYLDDAYTKLSVHESRFADNSAPYAGGAIWLRQDWAPVDREIRECVFTGNRAFAGVGGPILLSSAAGLLRVGESHFCGNSPEFFPDVVVVTQPNCVTQNCTNPLPIAYPEGIPGACESYVEDFDGLVTEIKPIVHAISGLPTGAVCWRVYAGFDEGKTNASVNSIFGNSSNLLLVESQAGFYQKTVTNKAGEIVQFDLARDIDCKSTDPGFLYDSFFTIGGDCQGFSVAQATPGLSFSGFNAVTGVCSFSTNDEGIYTVPGDATTLAGSDLRVLLMQLTTKDATKPIGRINLQGRNAAGGTANVWWAYQLRIPDPVLVDCNGNFVHDALDIASGTSRDCNVDGVPDSCVGQDPSLVLDCDEDGVPNACELRAGTEEDLNTNGIPDNCECPGDVDQNGRVDIDDLLEIFVYWGATNAPHADLDASGIVDAKDLAVVTQNWNQCNH
jgi:Right handed beta helix region